MKKMKQKQTHRYREQTDSWSFGVWIEKVKRLRNTDWQLQNSHGDIKYSIGNIAKDVVITKYGTSWYLKYQQEHFVKYMLV